MDTINKLLKKKSRIAVWALHYWTKWIGVNPLKFTEGNNQEFTYIGLFYGFFLMSIWCCVFYLAVKERTKLTLPEETPISIIVDYMGLGWQFSAVLSTWFVSAIYQNRAKLIFESFARASKISTELGIPDNYDELFIEISKKSTIINLVLVISMTFSEEMWAKMENFRVAIWRSFNLPSLAAFNMTLLFLWSLVFVTRKLHRLNVKVRHLARNNCHNDNESTKRSEDSIESLNYDNELLSERITLISQLHRNLRDIIQLVDEHFALPLILYVGYLATYLTLDIYGLYRSTKITDELTVSIWTYVGAVAHWLIVSLAMLMVISHICGSTLDEVNNTGNLLHAMLNDLEISDPKKKNVGFVVLSLSLLHKEPTMSPFGLIKLNHFLFYSILATTISYLAIMLQFYR